MVSTTTTAETLRTHAKELFTNIGVSRIIVVDDQYSTADVEDLLGICATLDPTLAVDLPHLDKIDFRAPQAIWTDGVREVWDKLNATGRQELVAGARAADTAVPLPVTSGDVTEEISDASAASTASTLY